MHLVARRGLQVQWPGGSRLFVKGDWIHTENSYKYSIESFSALLGRAGYSVAGVFQDSQKGFAVFVGYPQAA
jgi:uncharacterized SAM-dependent methyltransferase